MRLVLSDRALTSVPVGRDFEYVDLSALKIAPCVGCFGCWPGGALRHLRVPWPKDVRKACM